MVYGIVAEYNPFHKGHKYLIDQVKGEQDFVIAVMSGNFVQRGDFAVLPKWERAKSALQGGVDLVIELPTPFAIKSAHGFANAAVRLLTQTGCVDKLLFGAETAAIDELQHAATLLASPSHGEKVKTAVRQGVSYPRAQQEAAGLSVLDTPNNLLAIEYLTALAALQSPISPIVCKRIGCAHDSSDRGTYPSASFLRQQMADQEDACLMSRCDIGILSTLRRMSTQDFRLIEDVTEGLEYRITTAVKTARSTCELYDRIKSKRYTHARIRRIILRAFLGIKKDDFPSVPYLRVLGFHERAVPLIKQMKQTGGLPVLQRHSDVKALSPACQSLYAAECGFTDQYAMGFRPVLPCGLEMTVPVVKIAKETRTL